MSVSSMCTSLSKPKPACRIHGAALPLLLLPSPLVPLGPTHLADERAVA